MYRSRVYLDLTPAGYVGETVTIRDDPRDLAEIGVYHQDRFVCRAVSPDLSAQTISSKDLQAAPTTAAARQARRRLALYREQ